MSDLYLSDDKLFNIIMGYKSIRISKIFDIYKKLNKQTIDSIIKVNYMPLDASFGICFLKKINNHVAFTHISAIKSNPYYQRWDFTVDELILNHELAIEIILSIV